jgi:uncharacterized membrane protein AbrB (regulator of aidB expression)
MIRQLFRVLSVVLLVAVAAGLGYGSTVWAIDDRNWWLAPLGILGIFLAAVGAGIVAGWIQRAKTGGH